VLVLTRKLSETIYIGDDVKITVVEIQQGRVRLGIEAPRSTPVYREELLPTDHRLAKPIAPRAGG
jgi:carbon storage regulator